MADHVIALALLLAGLVFAGFVPTAAAELNDPTRPPAGFVERAASGEATALASPPAPLELSALFLMGDSPYAVLDGQVVRVGDSLPAGRVIRIDEHGVRLKTPAGTRQLELLPEVKKTPAGRARMEKTP
jgi:hypothetical protein